MSGRFSFRVSLFPVVVAAMIGPVLARADSKAALPPAIANFKMTKPVQIFSPSTLENHIDGQAESVKKYDFKQCDYAEYAPGGQGNQLITVDIYEMGSPLDSFGYYSFQLFPSASSVKQVKIGGVSGYQTKDSINFWKGSNYVVVTITAANAPANYQAALPQFAQAISAKLTGTTTPPVVLAMLPAGFTPNTQRYQRSDIAAQTFLKNGVVANYPAAGQRAELFIAEYPSADAAKQAFTQYSAYLSKPTTAAAGSKAEMLKGMGDNAISVRTKFAGLTVAALKSKYVVGVRQAKDPVAAQALVKSAIAKAK